MNLRDLSQIKELVSVATTLKPIISQSADELLDAYGPELGKIFSRLNNYLVEQTITMIRKYEAEGFTREEAILLTLNNKLALKEVIQNVNGKQQ
jgi:hypothetical protein